MASAKEYGYFVKGQKLALVEKDTALDNDVNSRDYGPDTNRERFKSPLSAVADGIELEYVYSPEYFINQTDDKNTALEDYYVDNNGFLGLRDPGGTNFSTSPESLSADSYFVLRGAGQFNGLHKVQSLATSNSTNDTIVTYTKFQSVVTATAFERTVSLYYSIDTLNDEDDVLHISEYLSKAVVYFVKAKIAEDRGDFQQKEYFMKEFYKMVHRGERTKIHTIRRVSPSYAAIR